MNVRRRPTRRLAVTLVASTLLGAWLASGCAEPDVELRTGVVLSSRAHLAVASTEAGPLSPSVGLIGQSVLLSWSTTDSELWLHPSPLALRFRRFARWYVDESEASSTLELGLSAGYVEQWRRDAGSLVAQAWGDPNGLDPLLPEQLQVHVLRLMPGSTWTFTPVPVPMANPSCAACPRLYMPTLASSPGWGALPTVDARGAAWIALAFPSSLGGCRALLNDFRLHIAPIDGQVATPWSWLHPLCDDTTWRPAGRSEGEVLNPWVFSTPLDTLGVAFLSPRSDGRGGSDGAYFYMYADPSADGQPFREPREPVLIAPHRPSMEDGHQPRATALGSRILAAMLSHDSSSRCYTLRTFEVDGSDNRETPWQLPCRRDASVSVHYVELATISHGALLVYSLRPNPSTAVLDDAVIEAVVVTPEGRRGSEVVRITPPEARAHPIGGVAPFAEGRPALATEGDRAVVAWTDAREDAPGLYYRHVEVQPLRTASEVGP